MYVLHCEATNEYVTLGDELNLCPTYDHHEALRFTSVPSARRVSVPLSRLWGRTFDVVRLP